MKRIVSGFVAALVLISASPQDRVAGLFAKLKSSDPLERVEAENALVKLGARVKPRLEKARQGADLEFAFRVDLVLRAIALRKASRRVRVSDLAEEYPNRGADGRKETIRQLAAHPDAKATPALAEIAVRETDVKVKMAAIDALGYRREDAAREALEQLIDDATAVVRARSLRSLLNFGVRVEPIEAGLADQDVVVREAAAEGVAHLPLEKASPLVADMLRDTRSRKILEHAFDLSVRLRDPKLVSIIHEGFKEYDRVVRARALNALVKMRLAESARILIGSFEVFVSPENRQTLRQGVIDAHDPSVIPDLLALLRCKNPAARGAALAMLIRLSSELEVPGPRPKLLKPSSLKARSLPPDKRVGTVVDGEWNLTPWDQFAGRPDPKDPGKKLPAVELEIDLGRLVHVSGIRLIVPTHIYVDVGTSEDGAAFESVGKAQLKMVANAETWVLNRKARTLKFSVIPRVYNLKMLQYREVMVYESESGDLFEEWDAWWEGAKAGAVEHAGDGSHASRLAEAQAAWERGDPGAALKRVKDAMKDGPKCLRALRLRGILRQALGEGDRGVADLREVSRRIPEDWFSHYFLAAAQISKKRKKESLDGLERAVQAGCSSLKALSHPVFAPLADDPRYKKLLGLFTRRRSPRGR